MRRNLRKKEACKVKQTTRQSNTAHPRQSLLLRKMSCLGWDSNPQHSTTELPRQLALILCNPYIVSVPPKPVSSSDLSASRAVAVASSNLFRCIMSRRDIIGPAGASPPSRTTGPRCLHVFIRSVCQIPLISKCSTSIFFNETLQ